ncbi:MAG: MFS transporter [Actinobacteria bacterium]|nr:MFS transporter [Actinomycetota bacterium]
MVLADSSIVTLGLPAILREFDASVSAVAWVLISFNLALALVAVAGARLARGHAGTAFGISLLLFAAACVVCAIAPSLGVLIAARAAQGLFGAVVVAAALELLVLSAGRGRALTMWAAAGVLGAAVGPALGGFLTEWLSWEAIFVLQVPVALVALTGVSRRAGVGEPGPPAGEPSSLAALVALALASAALAAALFLLVILLIEGWRQSPAVAALTVTVMPLAALVGGAWGRRREGLVPAIAGSLLVAGGLAALGLMPGAHALWTVAPQLAIGAGLGLALASLIGASIGNASDLTGPAAWTIAARHAGIVAGLLLLTPIFTADLESVQPPAERAGLARVLDAPLSLETKIELARSINAEINAAAGEELPDIDAAFRGLDVPPAEQMALAELRDDLEDELERGATQAFSRSFLVAALLALLAAGAALAGMRSAAGARPGSPSSNGSTAPRLAVAVPGAIVVATLLVAVYLALGGAGFGPREVADPCAPRARPAGIDPTQRAALAILDGAACKLGVSREALLRTLLEQRRPRGVSQDEFGEALVAGVERAEKEGGLGGFEADALRFALRTGGARAVLGLLLPE